MKIPDSLSICRTNCHLETTDLLQSPASLLARPPFYYWLQGMAPGKSFALVAGWQFTIQMREIPMNRLIALGIGLCWLPAVALAANPATTHTGTTVENVDKDKQTISIKTKTGESWTLKVSDPEMLKKYDLHKGDQVSVEVDTNNTITKIAKAGEMGQTGGGGMGQGSGTGQGSGH